MSAGIIIVIVIVVILVLIGAGVGLYFFLRRKPTTNPDPDTDPTPSPTTPVSQVPVVGAKNGYNLVYGTGYTGDITVNQGSNFPPVLGLQLRYVNKTDATKVGPMVTIPSNKELINTYASSIFAPNGNVSGGIIYGARYSGIGITFGSDLNTDYKVQVLKRGITPDENTDGLIWVGQWVVSQTITPTSNQTTLLLQPDW